MPALTLQAELTDGQAAALVRFAKRATFDTFRQRATDEPEAHEMRDALDAIAQALAKAGYAPR